jgi:hypothetical protein
MELEARGSIKAGYAGGQRRDWLINPAMDRLKRAKAMQGEARAAKDALRNLAADIQAALVRNAKVHAPHSLTATVC